jgi:hypothetical protein
MVWEELSTSVKRVVDSRIITEFSASSSKGTRKERTRAVDKISRPHLTEVMTILRIKGV